MEFVECIDDFVGHNENLAQRSIRVIILPCWQDTHLIMGWNIMAKKSNSHQVEYESTKPLAILLIMMKQ